MTSIYHNYVISSTSELRPTYRISPFSEDFIAAKNGDKNKALDYLGNRFSNYCLMRKGRTAISKALAFYNLRPTDVVTILTTSENFYISGCVTKEIEKFCLWSRIITSDTKVLFVNHEFGYPYKDLAQLRKYGLPVIEDCAHTFFSKNDTVGKVGDFVIYSLPKAFPIQIGGILSSNNDDIPLLSDLTIEEQSYLLKSFAYHLPRQDEIIAKRRFNYNLFCEKLKPLSIQPFFEIMDNEDIVPGVFLFRWKDDMDYAKLRLFMQANGVESSVFYGQNAYFIPIHDFLREEDIDYICVLLEYFYNKQ
jgi:hypothetical protein